MSRKPEPVDLRVAAKVRARRVELGLTQQDLADAIGVTYQQAHKYERGVNRLSPGRLDQISIALSVPVSYFFEDAVAQFNGADQYQRGRIEAARAVASLTNPKHVAAIANLARALNDA